MLGLLLAEREPDAVVTSPLLRARETADALAEVAGLEAVVDERLAPGRRRGCAAGRGRRPRRDGDRRRPSARLRRDRTRAHGAGALLPHRRLRRARALMGAERPAIRVAGLAKRYGSHEALRGIDFEIAAGEVFGLLGPNGAGKTTTIEILEGYRERDAGEVEVLGEDPQRADRTLARAAGRRAPVVVALPVADGAREPPSLRRLLREPPRPGRGDRDRRAHRQGGRALPHALGRPEAPARPRARADRQPRARLPRRADHGLRPRRSPGGLGDDPQPALARHDDPADDPLSRRGGAALRPRGGAARRADRAGRDTGRADGRAPRRPRSATG